MPIDQTIIEEARVVDSQESPLVLRLEERVQAIAQKLFPELNWDANPVEFRIGDNNDINARTYVNAKPPVIVIDRGLLEFVRNEDELAFVIGHEMGHKHIREKLGYEAGDRDTKTEEEAADIISILRCVKAGYNYNAARDFFRHLQESINGGAPPPMLLRLMAAHPLDGNRIAGVELALANENLFKSGTVQERDYTPLEGVLAEKDDFAQLRHKPFLDTFLPADYEELSPGNKMEWLRKALETSISEKMFVEIAARSTAILGKLRKIKTTPDDDQAREEAGNIIAKVRACDSYNGKHRFDSFYMAATRTLGDDPPLMEPFIAFGEAADAFLSATPEQRDEASEKLIGALQGISPYLHDTGYLHNTDAGIHSSVIKETKAFSLLQIALPTAMLHAKTTALSPAYERALWCLGGAFNAAFRKLIGEKRLEELKDVQPFLGYEHWSSDSQLKQFFRVRDDIDKALLDKKRQAALAHAPSFLIDPEAYMFAHGAELFPRGNPNNKPGSAKFTKPAKPLKLSFDKASSRHAWIKFAKKSPQIFKPLKLSEPSEPVKPVGPPIEPKENIHQKIRDEVLAAFKSGRRQRIATAASAVLTLFQDAKPLSVYEWLGENGRKDHYRRSDSYIKRSKKSTAAAAKRDKEKDKIVGLLSGVFNEESGGGYPYKLDPDHPLAQLLLEAAPYLDKAPVSEQQHWRQSFRTGPDAGKKMLIYLLWHNVDCRKLDESTLLDKLQFKPPATVADALRMHRDVYNLSTNHTLASHMAGLAIDRIVEADASLSLESGNLLALSQLHKQNPEFLYSSLMGPDTIESIHDRIWDHFSAERFGTYAKTLEAGKLLDIYQFLETHNLFSGRESQKAIVEAVKESIDAAPSAEREHLFERLLFDHVASSDSASGAYTVKDLALRNFAIAGYADRLKVKFGEDACQRIFREMVTPVIDRIIKRSLPRDRVLILESLAQSLNIQAGLAQYIHDHLKPTKEDVIGSHLPVMGVETLMWQMERNDELRKAVIDYLSDPLSKTTVEKISAVVLKDDGLVKQMTRLDFAEEEGSVVLDKFGEDRLNQALMDLHDNFTALGIDKKTAILSLLLIPGKDRLDEAIQSAAYDEAVQMVFPKVFNHDAKYAAEAESFVHAFLDTAKDFERAPILAALMALSSGSSGGSPDSGSAEKTVADQAARIMSLLGPAYVKLGQAINSNPQSPQDWKDATAGLKSDTRIEPRWEAILRIKELLPEEQGKHIIRFGPDLGSASFNSALEVEMDETYDMRDLVALVERPHAWTRAETGFDHLARTIDHWNHPVAAQYHDTISEMIAEALDMARVETDQDLGTRQYQRAQEIYGGTTIEFQDRTKLTITPVSLYATADQVRLISLANGVHFSDLPETTQAELGLKRKVARAYVAFELSKILSGTGFDSDRHGQQLKVDVSDPENIRLNLYDFGGLDIRTPSAEAKKALGHALDQVAQGLGAGADPVTLFETSLAEVHDSEPRAHLLRARKAWLALQDFQKYVDTGEMIGVLMASLKEPVDKEIMSEFTSAQLLQTLDVGEPEFQIRRAPPPAAMPPKFLRRVTNATLH